jgi:two-component system, cell cycle response regulator CpdR
MAKILLAEDDESMRHFLKRALEKAGHKVTSVDRGDVAVPLIAGGGYDLLLTDIVMPEMDGIELARRAGKLAPKMRIMFITGFAAVALNRKGPGPTEAKVLSKPFHLRDLVQEVDRVLAA